MTTTTKQPNALIGTDNIKELIDPNTCPHCGAHEVHAYQLEFLGNSAETLQPVECGSCGAEWREVWRLVGYVNLEAPKEVNA